MANSGSCSSSSVCLQSLEQFLGVRLPLARHLDSARAGAGQPLHVGEAFTEVKVDELSLDDRVHTHEL